MSRDPSIGAAWSQPGSLSIPYYCSCLETHVLAVTKITRNDCKVLSISSSIDQQKSVGFQLKTTIEVERVLCEVTGEVSRDLVGLSAGIGGSPAKAAAAVADEDGGGDDGLVDRLRVVRSGR